MLFLAPCCLNRSLISSLLTLRLLRRVSSNMPPWNQCSSNFDYRQRAAKQWSSGEKSATWDANELDRTLKWWSDCTIREKGIDKQNFGYNFYKKVFEFLVLSFKIILRVDARITCTFFINKQQPHAGDLGLTVNKTLEEWITQAFIELVSVSHDSVGRVGVQLKIMSLSPSLSYSLSMSSSLLYLVTP